MEKMMKDIRIKKETYGLILITSNVCEYFIENNNETNKRLIDDLIDALNLESEKNITCGGKINDGKIEYINFWTVFGIHDLAILIKSNSKLDNAITSIGK